MTSTRKTASENSGSAGFSAKDVVTIGISLLALIISGVSFFLARADKGVEARRISYAAVSRLNDFLSNNATATQCLSLMSKLNRQEYEQLYDIESGQDSLPLGASRRDEAKLCFQYQEAYVDWTNLVISRQGLEFLKDQGLGLLNRLEELTLIKNEGIGDERLVLAQFGSAIRNAGPEICAVINSETQLNAGTKYPALQEFLTHSDQSGVAQKC